MIRSILPYENIVYHSKSTKDELIEHLQNEIAPEKAFGFGAHRHIYSRPYIGRVNVHFFEIKRAINYRNSFLPLIQGEILSNLSGSKIQVKMTLPNFIKAFLAIWFAGVTIACVFTSVNLLKNGLGKDVDLFQFIPFIMLLFGATLVLAAFKVESRKSIKDLEQLLNATRVN